MMFSRRKELLLGLCFVIATGAAILIHRSMLKPKPVAVATPTLPTPTPMLITFTPLPSMPTPTPTTPEPITPTPSPVPVLASEDALWQQMLAKREQVKTYRYAGTRLLLWPFLGSGLPEGPLEMERPFKLSIQGEFQSGNIHQVATIGDFQIETISYEGTMYSKVQEEWTQRPLPSTMYYPEPEISTWVEELSKIGPDPLEHAPVQTIKYQFVLSEEIMAKAATQSLRQVIDSAKTWAADASEMESQLQALVEALTVKYYVWIGEDGLLYQLVISLLAHSEEQDEIVECERYIIKYYDYNDPTIVVEPPKVRR